MTSPSASVGQEVATPGRSARATDIGYVRAPDGTRLWYRSEGPDLRPPLGAPALVCCNGVGVSTHFWEPTQQFFRDRVRTVIWDYRAHGNSDPGPHPEAMTIEQCADDCLTLLDALGIEQAVLLGHSMGAPTTFEVVRKAPGRVVALVPTLGTHARAVESFLDLPIASKPLFALSQLVGTRFPSEIGRLVRLVLSVPGTGEAAKLLGLVHPDLIPKEQLDRYIEHLRKLDLRAYFSLTRSLAGYDASELLRHLTIPMLVVGGSRDLFTPLRMSAEMAALTPGAELFVIQNGTHAALVEQAELYCLRVEKFLRDRVGFSWL